MATIPRGAIVWAESVDENGVNPEVRPWVLFEDFDDSEDDRLFVVAITSTFKEPLRPELVLVPWQRDKNTPTRLDRKSVAKCDWRKLLRPDEVQERKGHVPDRYLFKIIEIVNRLRNPKCQ